MLTKSNDVEVKKSPLASQKDSSDSINLGESKAQEDLDQNTRAESEPEVDKGMVFGDCAMPKSDVNYHKLDCFQAIVRAAQPVKIDGAGDTLGKAKALFEWISE